MANREGTMETVRDFILGGSKITADGDWSHEIKRRSLLGRKVMTNLNSILKIRDINLPTKIHLVKAVVFPVVMYGCESWTIKKAEHWRIDALELWCWRKLESPLDCKEIKLGNPKGNQSWIFIRRTDAEAPILWPSDVKNWLFGKDPDAGKVEGRRRRGQQKMRWLDGITDSMDMSFSSSSGWWWTGKPGVLQSMSSQRVVHDWVTKLNWCQNRKSSELFLEDQKFVVFLDYFSRVVDNTKNMIIILFASRVRWRN